MKPMIWHPEANDPRIRSQANAANRAPYAMIATIGVAGFCLFTLLFLLGTF
jgi:hypothetical protein